ncbi:unnamed protein product [Diatraea saccharalis]|uniref:Uncharacterized protein n=1 Tax=Diatraea saccharalis TaxID=40085 RepID=A0A9N9R0J2_9NEOP|nr:unnamed protein product [Diatraea saccharalis]
MFSALSKFELSKWSQSVDTNTRREMLNSLTAAAQRWGFAPTEEYLLLVELLGVQMSTVCHATELCVLASMCARACVSATLPPAVLRHIVRAAEKCAAEVPFDQLGHLLRELGIIWWEARTKATESDIERYDAYAPHTAGLLLTLHRAFVEAAFSLSYTPEKG